MPCAAAVQDGSDQQEVTVAHTVKQDEAPEAVKDETATSAAVATDTTMQESPHGQLNNNVI